MEVKLTSGQLCEAVGMSPTRFATLLRRALKALHFDEGESFGEADLDPLMEFPCKLKEPGVWARYDFKDALMLRCVLVLEAAGLTWSAACAFVANASASDYLDRKVSAPDFWVGRSWSDTDGGRHASGSRAEVVARLGEASFSQQLNVSDVARKLIAKLV